MAGQAFREKLEKVQKRLKIVDSPVHLLVHVSAVIAVITVARAVRACVFAIPGSECPNSFGGKRVAMNVFHSLSCLS